MVGYDALDRPAQFGGEEMKHLGEQRAIKIAQRPFTNIAFLRVAVEAHEAEHEFGAFHCRGIDGLEDRQAGEVVAHRGCCQRDPFDHRSRVHAHPRERRAPAQRRVPKAACIFVPMRVGPVEAGDRNHVLAGFEQRGDVFDQGIVG